MLKPDPFYGHKYATRLCAQFITHLFTCPEYPPSSTYSQAKFLFFIAYALHNTKLHQVAVVPQDTNDTDLDCSPLDTW
jgi:hypothetical protein